MKTRIHAAVAAAVLSVGTLLTTAVPASAHDYHDRGRWNDLRQDRRKEDTFRDLTYGLGAVTVLGAVKHSPLVAGIGALGTAYSYSQWKGAERDRHRDEWGYGYGRHGYRDYGRRW